MKVTLTFPSALTFPLLLNGELKTIGKSLVKFTTSVGWSAIREAAGPRSTVHNLLPSHFLLFKGEVHVDKKLFLQEEHLFVSGRKLT